MVDKEGIFVYVEGGVFGTPAGQKEIYRGPHTHMRSEGTWVLGIALNMARHGHPTTIAGYPWGDINQYPLPKNITLQKECKGEYDIFINVGWGYNFILDRVSNIKAGHYIFGWGGDPAGSDLLEYVTKHNITNYYMARTSRCFKGLFAKFPYNIYMPTPIIDKIKDVPNVNSKKMLWGNRGAFHPWYTPQSEKVLEFMERHPDYEYTVLLYGDIKERSIKNNMLDIVQRFEKLPNAHLLEPYTGIPHDDFIRELDQSKILLANGLPSAHPQTLEAVCNGCIPLIWKTSEHHFQDNNGNVNERFGFNGANVDKLLDDDELYIRYFRDLANATKDHEYNNAYNIFMEEIRNKSQ